MNIFILSKRQFDELMIKKGLTVENVESKVTKAALISICSEVDQENYIDQRPHFNKDTSNVLNLLFEDITEDLWTKTMGKDVLMKAFTKDQGLKVIEFLNKHKDKETLIIHCAAGISRSGAIGTFAAEYFNVDLEKFNELNPHIHPNSLVITTLRKLINK